MISCGCVGSSLDAISFDELVARAQCLGRIEHRVAVIAAPRRVPASSGHRRGPRGPASASRSARSELPLLAGQMPARVGRRGVFRCGDSAAAAGARALGASTLGGSSWARPRRAIVPGSKPPPRSSNPARGRSPGSRYDSPRGAVPVRPLSSRPGSLRRTASHLAHDSPPSDLFDSLVRSERCAIEIDPRPAVCRKPIY